MVRYGSKNDTKKTCVSKRLDFVNHSRRNSQNNDHSMRKIIFTLIMNEMFM